MITMKALYADGSVRETDDELPVIRHTASHIMAQAVQRIWPGTKLAIGPAIDDGFYYDFDKEGGFSPEDLEKIEAEMKKIIKENLKLETYTLPRDEAIEFLRSKGEDYKVQLVEDLPEDAPISFYKQGEFVDLCAGPHALYTKGVKAFKLLSLAGAYWRGDAGPRSTARRSWRPTSTCWRRPRRGTTASWARSSVCSPSWRRDPGSRSSSPRGWS